MENTLGQLIGKFGFNIIEIDKGSEVSESYPNVIALSPILYIDKSLLKSDVTQKAGVLKIGSKFYPAYAGGVLDSIEEVIYGSVSIINFEREPSDYSLDIVV